MKGKKILALVLAFALLAAGLLSGCAATEASSAVITEEAGTALTEEAKAAVEAFQSKAEALRAVVLSDQVQERLEEAPAGEAGYALFLSLCSGEERAAVYSGTGKTPDAAWDAAAQAAESALKKGGPFPYWLKADLVYVSAPLSADALEGIGELFGVGGFRYGLAFDSDYKTAFLEAELNTAGIYDYETGGVDLERLNAYLTETGRTPLTALPESYTAFQCAGWLCDETGSVFQLSLGEPDYGHREFSAVDGSLAAALALDGAEYLAGRVQEDGSILLPGGDALPIPRHAEALSALARGYQLHPSDALAQSINRAAGWLAGQIAYTENDIGFLLDNGEITLEDSALALIALADCAEASGNTAYLPACEALGSGLLSLLNSGTGAFTHVLNAADLGQKEAFRSAQWDGMGVTALCRLYAMTEDSLWLWAAQLVLDRTLTDGSAASGGLWTAYAVREMTKHVSSRTDYFIFALQTAQASLGDLYGTEAAAPAGLETLLLYYEAYRAMLDAGYAADGFAPELLAQVAAARAQRQLDGYLFPEFAMYFAEPQNVLGAFMTRENGLSVSADALCRNINSYYLYSVHYAGLAASETPAAG